MKCVDGKDYPLIFIHILFWSVSTCTMEMLAERDPYATFGNDYFLIVYVFIIMCLVLECLKLKKIGFKNHVNSLSKKALGWHVVIEGFIILMSANYISDALSDEAVMPRLQLFEASFNAVLASSLGLFFLYLRFKKKPA